MKKTIKIFGILMALMLLIITLIPVCSADEEPDSDGDGLSDSEEDKNGDGEHQPEGEDGMEHTEDDETDPNNPDTDGDGINDYDEVNYDGDPDYNPYDTEENPEGTRRYKGRFSSKRSDP